MPTSTLTRLAPLKPKKSWLDGTKPPGLTPHGKKYIGSEETGDQGRVAAYYFTWDQCLEEGNGECWMPQRTKNNYQMFHQGTVETEEGEEVAVGTVGAGGGHPKLDLDAKTANLVYGDTNQQRFVATLHEDEHGGYFTGAFVPTITEEQIAEVRRSPLSADFRWRTRAPKDGGGYFTGYDNIGPWLVTRPALPLARVAALTSASQDTVTRRKLTVPLGGEDNESPCAKVAALGMGDEEPSAAPSSLQVGVDGFQGFEEGPIGPQMDAMGLGSAAQGAAPAGPDPAVAEMRKELNGALERIEQIEAMITEMILGVTEAPDLIMNEMSMPTPEEFTA